MGALSSSPPLILRWIIRRPPPSATAHIFSFTPSFYKFYKHTPSAPLPTSSPLSISTTTLPSLTPRSLSTATPSPTAAVEEQSQTQNDVGSEFGNDDGKEPIEEKEPESPVDARISGAHKEMLAKLKGMNVKEKKELGSYANSLGNKLKSQQIGKSGVTEAVATALVETLEANELLKLKINNNCPGELDDVVSQLEQSTGSVVVGQIGRTVIIYRPSLTKLKAEEKKKHAQKVFLKRKAAFKPPSQGKAQNRRQSSTPFSYSRTRGGSRRS